MTAVKQQVIIVSKHDAFFWMKTSNLLRLNCIVLLTFTCLLKGRSISNNYSRILHNIHEVGTTSDVTPPSLCHSWDDNTDEWWTHHPDWEVSLENDTHYCFSPIQNEKKAQLFREIYDIQMSPNANCSNVISKVQISSGWGADIANIVDGLYMALDAKQPMQVFVPQQHQQWHYAALKRNGSNPACSRKDFFCYFLNLTHCPPNPEREAPFSRPDKFVFFVSITDRWLTQYVTRPQTWLRKASYEFAKKRLVIHRPSSTQKRTDRNPTDLTPNIASNDTTNKLPGVVALDRVTNTRVQIPSCVVIHVRRADVVLHKSATRKYHAISEYLEAFWNQSSHPPSNNPTFFLLTDDANAISEALALHGEDRWMYVDRPRFRGAEGGWENQLPSGKPKFEVAAMLGIFRLVQQCGSTFVFGSSSFANYIQGILLERNYSNNTTEPKLITLDPYGTTVHHPNHSATLAISRNYATAENTHAAVTAIRW